MAAHRANTYPLHDRPLPPPPFERPSEDSIRVIQDTSFSLPSLKRLKEKCDRLRRWPMLIYDRFIERIGLNEHVNPQNNTVVWSITSFLLFVLFCSLAVVFPVRSMRVAVLVLGISLFIILSIKLLHDFKTKRAYSYVRNLGNTVLIALFSVLALTVLYEFRWYHQLHKMVIQVSQDSDGHPGFPAVAILSELYASQQAKLFSEPLKCFLGRFDETSPYCNSLSSAQLQSASSCNCNDSWVPGIQSLKPDTNVPDSIYGYQYLLFHSSEQIFARDENDYMTLQAFYNFNASADTSMTGPQLWLMVYDPALTFEEAYSRRKGPPLSLYDANSLTNINLGLTFNHSLDDRGYYNYGLQFSSIPNRHVICDTSHNRNAELCHTTVRLQIPRFERTTYRQQMSMTMSDVVSEAGSYFALVQFLSWIISGQVWAAV